MTAPSHRPIDYAHYWPWTRLFRAFRIATDPRKLILAAVAVTVFWTGETALSYLPFAPATAPDAPWNAVRPTLLIGFGHGETIAASDPEAEARSIVNRLLVPIQPLLAAASLPFSGDESWSNAVWTWSRVLWAFVVWSLFGGAIARLTAVEFARDERRPLMAAVSFSLRRFGSLLAAPLLPLGGILALWAMCALGGFVGHIPFAGPWIVAAAWGAALIISLLIVLIAVATVAGWPLMVAAVATENSDAFDGFSRAFSYLYGRPWIFLWCGAVALLIGMLFVVIVDTLAVATTVTADRAVATGFGEQNTSGLLSSPPGYLAAVEPVSIVGAQGWEAASLLIAVWLRLFATLAVGFATSYFWTAATILYFLLRRADDATHFGEVWLSDADDEDELLPLAGIASTDQPVTERSHHPTAGPPVTMS